MIFRTPIDLGGLPRSLLILIIEPRFLKTQHSIRTIGSLIYSFFKLDEHKLTIENEIFLHAFTSCRQQRASSSVRYDSELNERLKSIVP